MRAFEGKVALVTGGSPGLGAAAALQFAREGAKVTIATHPESFDLPVREAAKSLTG